MPMVDDEKEWIQKSRLDPSAEIIRELSDSEGEFKFFLVLGHGSPGIREVAGQESGSIR